MVQAGERAWDDLAELTALQHLDASFSDLSDASVACLRPLEQLTRLALDSTDLSSKALMSIKRLRSLRVLDLADTTCARHCILRGGCACAHARVPALAEAHWLKQPLGRAAVH